MKRINENEFKQLCRLLQIQTDVTIKDLRKAYYQLAKNYHPDKNPGDELATTHFILVSRAYQTLCTELHHRNAKRSMESCTNTLSFLLPISLSLSILTLKLLSSNQKERKSSIVEQFLSDLKRQDVDWPKSNSLYNEKDNCNSPIEKLLNHLLEATLVNETNLKREQTSAKKYRFNFNKVNVQQTSQPTAKYFCEQNQQQECGMPIPATNEKSIVPYCNDENNLTSQIQSNSQHSKYSGDCFIQRRNTDLSR
ncbi:unnamed protein product [Schistosoma turkestanicum]|nr:unnamed protein product [Schistosoma turkestanicum]